MPGRVEVEDVADALDVEATRRDVGGDENVDIPVLEPVQFGDTARLIHVAMNLASAVTIALQRFSEFAHRRLAVAEDDRGRDILFLEDRKSVVEGKCVSVRVDLGGRRIIKNKHK